jgi:hypothetical protein
VKFPPEFNDLRITLPMPLCAEEFSQNVDAVELPQEMSD